jgi:hypothetical protein
VEGLWVQQVLVQQEQDSPQVVSQQDQQLLQLRQESEMWLLDLFSLSFKQLEQLELFKSWQSGEL